MSENEQKQEEKLVEDWPYPEKPTERMEHEEYSRKPEDETSHLNELTVQALQNVPLEVFGERISKVAADTKKDFAIMKKLTDSYTEKYSDEIAEGTEKKKLLLEQGISEGKTEEDVESEYNGEFLPSTDTPTLNWLHFFMDGEHQDNKKEKERIRLNKKHEEEIEDVIDYKAARRMPDMHEFLYGNVDGDVFEKLKKLKAMSLSDNENESKRADEAGKRICTERDLEWDQIPTTYSGSNN